MLRMDTQPAYKSEQKSADECGRVCLLCLYGFFSLTLGFYMYPHTCGVCFSIWSFEIRLSGTSTGHRIKTHSTCGCCNVRGGYQQIQIMHISMQCSFIQSLLRIFIWVYFKAVIYLLLCLMPFTATCLCCVGGAPPPPHCSLTLAVWIFHVQR